MKSEANTQASDNAELLRYTIIATVATCTLVVALIGVANIIA